MQQFAQCANLHCALLGNKIPLIYLRGSRICEVCGGALIIDWYKHRTMMHYELERYPTPLAISLQRLNKSSTPHKRCYKLI